MHFTGQSILMLLFRPYKQHLACAKIAAAGTGVKKTNILP